MCYSFVNEHIQLRVLPKQNSSKYFWLTFRVFPNLPITKDVNLTMYLLTQIWSNQRQKYINIYTMRVDVALVFCGLSMSVTLEEVLLQV